MYDIGLRISNLYCHCLTKFEKKIFYLFFKIRIVVRINCETADWHVEFLDSKDDLTIFTKQLSKNSMLVSSVHFLTNISRETVGDSESSIIDTDAVEGFSAYGLKL